MDMDRLSRFKDALRDSGVLGIFMKTGDPAFVEAAGYAGLDFAVLDMEHGPVGPETMQNNIRAAEVAGMVPVVRVESVSETAIGKALDIGAAGVQVPQVATAEAARRAVGYAKFHPLGERGVCRFVRAARYSAIPGAEYFPRANQGLVILQLEGVEAVRNLDDILEVDGVDVLFIGPYDLSQSLGLTGQTTHPEVVRCMRSIVDKAARRGTITGTFTDSPETLAVWREAGVRYITYSVDVGLFHDACRNLRKRFDAFGHCEKKEP